MLLLLALLLPRPPAVCAVQQVKQVTKLNAEESCPFVGESLRILRQEVNTTETERDTHTQQRTRQLALSTQLAPLCSVEPTTHGA